LPNALIRNSKFVQGVTANLRQWKAGTYRQTEWACEQQTKSIIIMRVGSDGNPDRENGAGIGQDY